MTWKDRYERMKKHYQWNNEQIADMIGNSPGSVREVVRKEPFPRWLRLAVIIFEKENNLEG
jgi:hypothetical protein